MALQFSDKELQDLRKIAYGGYKTTSPMRVRQKDGGYRTVGGGGIDYGFYSGQSTSGMAGFNQKQNPTSRNFARIAQELGLKSINSPNDIAAMYDWLGRATASSEQKKTNAASEPTPAEQASTGPTVNNVETASDPGVEDVREDTERSRMDPGNLNRWGVRADRFGMRDLFGAYQSGYSQGDVYGWLSTQPTFSNGASPSGGYNPAAPWYQGLQEISRGQISTKFFNPDVAAYDPGGNGGTDFFSRDDLIANRKGGFSDREIVAFLDANPNVLRAKNKKGAQGGLYETIKAGLPPEPRDPTNYMIGSTALGNAGNASGVRPKRSEASQSGRSSFGTSQYNRSNFGTTRSPLAIGLNI